MSIKSQTKRGDTLIEVMLALAVFALVTIVTVSMMNNGVAIGERSLELVTARSEVNAQAEAIRFIHSSYAAELTLPPCTPSMIANKEKCQQFRTLWQTIANNALESSSFSLRELPDTCARLYENENQILNANNAFVINTRRIYRVNDDPGDNPTNIYITSAQRNAHNHLLMREAALNSRIVFIKSDSDNFSDYQETEFNDEAPNDSSIGVLKTDPLRYRAVGAAEGIWVTAVKSDNRLPTTGKPTYYDFYIQTCWYSVRTKAPVSVDTVIRLYNPEGNKGN